MQVLKHVQVVQAVGLRGNAWAAGGLEREAGEEEGKVREGRDKGATRKMRV